ncbi:hypothetical protein [Sediminibacter sp. Hel_I_10]|uniref:hypothetical protein n=1 Tax=Sediminibacter sp. Hel_I_10 TaxID=1392490 RepID=UPI00047CCF1D|nr:hypothetical protein [Sediminibacter sp. Hel_I_10]
MVYKLASKGLGKTTNLLDKVSKYALPIILIIVVYYFLKDEISAFFKKLSDTANSVGSSLTDLQAQQKADVLYNAMKGFGTDEDVIFQTLQGLSKSDFYKVSNKFGLRNYSETYGTGSQDSFIGDEISLMDMMLSELSPSDMEYIYTLLPFLGSSSDNKARKKYY